MIKKKNEMLEQEVEEAMDETEEELQALEQAIEITKLKLNKLYTKKANLEMDIDSLTLSLSLLEKELVK